MDTILTIVGGSLKTKLLTLMNLEKWRGLPKIHQVQKHWGLPKELMRASYSNNCWGLPENKTFDSCEPREIVGAP